METNYPKGIMVFSPRDGAPDFVKGQIVISLNELIQYCKDNPGNLSEYKGNKQLKLDLLDGKKGLYLKVNDYKPKEKEAKGVGPVDDLPF